MTRRSASPLAVWAGILVVLYVVWGSTYLGMKVAIDTLPPFVMGVPPLHPGGAPAHRRSSRSATGASIAPAVAGAASATRPSSARSCSSAGPASWPGASRRSPPGIAALLIGLVPMWLAIFGRVLFGDRVQPLAAVGHRRRPRRRRDPRLARRATSGQLDPAGLARARSCRRCSGRSARCTPPKRAVLPAPALFSTGHPDDRRRDRVPRRGRASPARRRASTSRPSRPPAGSASPTSSSWAASSGFTTYAWLLTVAPIAADRDLRVRQPGRRRVPRLADPGRAAHGADGRRVGRDRGWRSRSS